ncbi:serine/threonine-protein kinase [Actinomadura sp. KC216]|uniref:serine/threonine-protein kinase n=1 Tax=Actinomadura sp. KC216 TaxID=2530370 RepID=UPI00104E0057|nr:serine/threonine-protein kinase [Actinomadura sp. KC216]TDB79599.1 serine/threonine-protein kinase [Actinomadura sp. KC216]
MLQPLQGADPDRMGPYRLLGRLGAGGMGVVYLGRSPSGRPVAIKVIQRRFAGEPRFAARFRREVAAARRVTGAFTAPVLDADPDAPTPWLVTAYLPGLSLREAVTRFGPLPPPAVRPLAAGLAEALGEIHRAGVVHRDLKPGNVMLTAGGPRVIDFGISRPEDAVTITRANAPVGTPGFMAPEQLRAEKAEPSADIFVLGATLAYAATGKEPFGDGPMESRDLRVLNGRADLGGISEPWLLDLIGACLRLDPGSRPSAAGVLERLGPPGDDAPSLLGTRWLPAAVAEEIDRRTAEAAPLEHPAAPPAPQSLALNSVATSDTGAGPGGDGPGTEPPPPPLGTGRRTLLLGAGAALMTMTGIGSLIWRLTDDDRDPKRGPAAAKRSGAPETPQGPPPDGAARWKRHVSKKGRYLELAAGGGVVLANGDDGNEILHALDPRTGKIKWTRDGGMRATPHGGVTYLAQAEGQQICAVRTTTGKTLWTYDLSFKESGPTDELAITDSVIVFGIDEITALSRSNGRRRWTSKLPGRYGVSGVGDLLILLAGDALVGMDAASGKTRWRYPMDYPDFQVVGDGLVYAVDRFGTMHAVRTDNGARVWQRPNISGWGSQAGGGRCFLEAADGEILALDSATGKQLWSRELLSRRTDDPRGQATALGLAGPTLYVSCTDGVLYALSVTDGRIQWTYGDDAPNRTRPVTADGLVFIATENGDVRAVTPPPATPRTDGGPRATP